MWAVDVVVLFVLFLPALLFFFFCFFFVFFGESSRVKVCACACVRELSNLLVFLALCCVLCVLQSTQGRRRKAKEGREVIKAQVKGFC